MSAETRLKAESLLFGEPSVSVQWLGEFREFAARTPGWANLCLDTISLHYGQVVARDGHSRVAYYLLDEGNMNTAKEWFERDLELERISWYQRLRYAECLAGLGNRDEGLAVVDQVYAQYPEATNGRASIAWRLHRLGTDDNVLPLALEDVESDRLTPGYMLNIAELAYESDEPEVAFDLVERAYQSNSELANGFVRIGLLEWRKRNWQKGIEHGLRDLCRNRISEECSGSILSAINMYVNEKVEKTVSAKMTEILQQVDTFSKESILKRIMQAHISWKLPEGDYLEFGTWRGRSFINAYRYALASNIDTMRFIAFDSFQGLPSAGDESESVYERFYEGQFACDQQSFLDNLARGGVDLSKVRTVPGFFNESLTPQLKSELGIKRAAIVWIDADLYESTVPVLDWITDLIDDGTFLCFDDWFSFGGDPRTGEIRATREWLEKNPDIRLTEYRRFSADGVVFLVHRQTD